MIVLAVMFYAALLAGLSALLVVLLNPPDERTLDLWPRHKEDQT